MAFDINNRMPLDEGISAYQIRDQVIAEFHKRGFGMPQAPVWHNGQAQALYQGEIPSDLTVISDQQLGFYMSLLSLWINYVGIQMAMARMEKTIARQQLEFTEATIRLSYKQDDDGKKRTSQEREDMMRCDRRFIDANRTYLYLETFASLTEVVYKSAEQNFNAISRRITQRGQDSDRGNRGHSVSSGNPGAALLPPRRQ